jgi:hypothetical protein
MVMVGEVEVFLDGGGLRVRVDGEELPAHESAWSQFQPGTEVWIPVGR